MEALYSKYLACGGKVVTDSRKVCGGELFFALRGENFDGNLFAQGALESGAAFAVVEEGSQAALSADPRIIAVPDTQKALSELALYHRLHCKGDEHLIVVGLTGTNGKTTTKELIRSVLSAKFKVIATEGNLNNDIGVPITLLRIRPETEIAVVEMGANHPDDIEKLVKVCEPDLGLITNVGKAHLLGFGSFEGVKQAKGAIYRHLAAKNGAAFVNVSDPELSAMSAALPSLEVLPYGLEVDNAEVLPSSPEEPFLRLKIGGKTVFTHLVGAYNAANVLAAVAVGRRFGVSLEDAISAIESFVPTNNRSQMVRSERNTIIVDAYNANPSSMAVAIDNFAAMQAPCKLAILGDMRELGQDSLSEHVAVVKKLESLQLDAILVGSEFSHALEVTGVKVKGCFPDSSSLAEHLHSCGIKNATLLVKGSRGIMMERVLPEL